MSEYLCEITEQSEYDATLRGVVVTLGDIGSGTVTWDSIQDKPAFGGAALLNIGTAAGTVAAGDHSHASLTDLAVSGTLTVRQSGGTPGVDEGRLFDTGTVLVIERMTESGSTDAIAFRLNGVNYAAVRRAQGGLFLRSGTWLAWALDPATSVPATGLSQEAAGLVAVNDGTNAANYRDIKARDFIATRSLRMASFTVLTLPTPGTTARAAYASNGCKSGEGSGSGTGVPVWDDGTAWRTYYNNFTVSA